MTASAVESVGSGTRPVDEHGFEQRTHREILVVMSGLMVAMLLAMLDNMIVAPALPTIVGDLGGLQHLAWVTTAYILGSTIGTPLFGKLGDLYSRKTIFMISISIFLVGSALCGMAQSMGQLIAFRALQGIGAGGLMVGVMAVMAVLVPPRDRGRYTGYFMAIMPVSMIAGPLIGGWITDNASWRWAFYVNLPIGAMALAVIAVTMHLPTPAVSRVRIDWLGAALLTTWIGALVLVTSWGGTQYAWGSPTILALIVVTLAAFGAFLYVESTVVEPIMPLGVFRNLNFTLAATLSFVVGFGMFGGMTFLPQFQQYVQGASATNSGLLLLPMMLGIISSSLTCGQVISRTGHYKSFPVVGSVLMTIGLALLATMGIDTGRTVTGVYMFVLGLGMGMLFQTTMMIAQNSVAMRDIGSATAATTFMRSIGGSIGVSMLGALYAHRIAATLTHALGAANPLGHGGGQLSPAVVRTMPPAVLGALRHAITHGVKGVFGWAALICVTGIVIAAFIKQVPLRGSGRAPAAAAAPVDSLAESTAMPMAAGVAAAAAATDAVRSTVEGRVRESDGRGLPDAAVTALDRRGHEVAHCVTDASGRFVMHLQIDVEAGPHSLVFCAAGFSPQARPLLTGATDDVVLAALPPRILGRVHGPSSDLAVLSLLDQRGRLLARTTARSEGQFALGGLPEGAVSLVVQCPGFLPAATEVIVPADGAARVDVHLIPDDASGLADRERSGATASSVAGSMVSAGVGEAE